MYEIKKMIKGLCLLSILLITIAIAPIQLSKAETGNTQDVSSNAKIQQINNYGRLQNLTINIATRYIGLFGLTPVNVTLNSFSVTPSGIAQSSILFKVLESGKLTDLRTTNTFSLETQTGNGYRYQAEFQSASGKNYTIDESYNQLTEGKTVTTQFHATTSGAKKMNATGVEVKEMGPVVSKQSQISISFSNLTGNYYLNSQVTGTWNSNESRVLSGKMTIDQNVLPQAGKIRCDLATTNDGLHIKGNVTTPDGKMIDPYLYTFTDSGSLGSNLIIYYAAWNEDEQNLEGLLSWAIGGILGLIVSGVAAVFVTMAVTEIWAFSPYYVSTMTDSGTSARMVILYYTVELWDTIPVCIEAGFYTNQVNHVVGDWTYYPGYMVSGLQAIPHTSPWPLSGWFDPWISIAAVDESSNANVNNIPLSINGYYIGLAGEVFDLPAGTYTFQVPDSNGAFDHFNVGGADIYSNPATVTVSDDTTITAYYHYIPSYTITVDAYGYDNYGNGQMNTDVYIDGNWVGVSPMSIQVPLGFHSIGVDDPYYGGLETFNLNLLIGNNGYNNQWEIVTSDMSITAIYYSQDYWG